MADRARTVSIFLRNREGKVLAQLRDDKPGILFPACWSTLGGAIEDGETPDEAARRELLEETELAPPLRFWRRFDHYFCIGDTSYEVEIYGYVGETDIPVEAIHLHEGQRVAYLSREDIDCLPFAFGLDALFRAVFDENPFDLRITLATLDDAPLVYHIMREAFAEYKNVLQPPSGANRETVDDVTAAMQQGGALLAWVGEMPVASARFRVDPDALYVGRVAVLPAYRERGIAKAVMWRMEDIARQSGRNMLRVGVRMSLPGNLALYRSLGYTTIEVSDHPKGPDRIATLIKRLNGQAQP
ncbi:MAG: GNAT family N-acetyltransferase [Chloroflexi bacterium]|nr:GNAT family N-acetyltransferase [Chloroflexota bacterium]